MIAHQPSPRLRNNVTLLDGVEYANRQPVIDVGNVLRVLARRKVWFLVPLFIFPTAAFFVHPLLQVRYQANSQLLIDPRGLQVVDKELSPGSQGESNLQVVESQLKVITSERVLRGLIEREKLDYDYEFTDPTSLVSTLVDKINTYLGVKQAKREDSEVRALRTVQRRVSVRRNERSFIVDIYFEASTAQKAAKLADALAETYLEYEAAARSNVARRVEQSLSGRLSELRDQLRQAEERVEIYKAGHNIVGASGRLINEQQLLDINTQLGAARDRTAEMRARTDLIERARRSGNDLAAVAEAIQSPTISQMRAQELDIKRRQSDASTLLGPRHPETVTLEAQARSIRRQIDEELSRIASAARSDYERARAKEQTLARNVDALKGTAVNTSQAFIRLRELQREAESTRSVYENFLKRTKEVGEQQAVDSANTRVISRAVPPRDPVSMSLSVLLLAALAAGCVVGLLAAALREALAKPKLA